MKYTKPMYVSLAQSIQKAYTKSLMKSLAGVPYCKSHIKNICLVGGLRWQLGVTNRRELSKYKHKLYNANRKLAKNKKQKYTLNMRLRADLVLLLLFARGASGKQAESITGITRLTKLLFLLENETDVKDGFKFIPYKMGPYSVEITPVIEFLTNFPNPDDPLVLKHKLDTPTKIDPEEVRYTEDIVSDNDSPYSFAEENNQTFSLTDKGKKVAEVVWNEQTEDTQKSLEAIKSKYGTLSLRQLLKYVYSHYEDMTSNSEIKNWVEGSD